MKAILKFDLEDEFELFKHTLKGSEYLLALQEIANDLFRSKRKYGDKKHYTIEELEKEFYEILKDRHIELFD